MLAGVPRVVDHRSLTTGTPLRFLSAAPQAPAYFTGSEVRIRDPDQATMQFAVAFKGASWTDPDSIPLMVMQASVWGASAAGCMHEGCSGGVAWVNRWVSRCWLETAAPPRHQTGSRQLAKPLQAGIGACPWCPPRPLSRPALLSPPLPHEQTMLGAWDKNSGAGVDMASKLAQKVAANKLAHSYMAFNTNYHDTGAPGGSGVLGLGVLGLGVLGLDEQEIEGSSHRRWRAAAMPLRALFTSPRVLAPSSPTQPVPLLRPAGLFGVYAVADPKSDHEDLAWSIMQEVTRMCYSVRHGAQSDGIKGWVWGQFGCCVWVVPSCRRSPAACAWRGVPLNGQAAFLPPHMAWANNCPASPAPILLTTLPPARWRRRMWRAPATSSRPPSCSARTAPPVSYIEPTGLLLSRQA